MSVTMSRAVRQWDRAVVRSPAAWWARPSTCRARASMRRCLRWRTTSRACWAWVAAEAWSRGRRHQPETVEGAHFHVPVADLPGESQRSGGVHARRFRTAERERGRADVVERDGLAVSVADPAVDHQRLLVIADGPRRLAEMQAGPAEVVQRAGLGRGVAVVP